MPSAYILASYSCDVCNVNMPQIADQAGAGYFGWSAEFVKDEARRHNLSAGHLKRVAEQDKN